MNRHADPLDSAIAHPPGFFGMMESTKTNDPNDICRQMSEVRCSLGEDVEEIVESARTLTDWHYYVKTYPWYCLAGAAAVGYLVVPKRVEIMRPSAGEIAKLAKRHKLVVSSNPKPQPKSGITGAILSLVANAVVRGAMGYVGQNAGKMFSKSAGEGDSDEKSNR